MLASALGDRYVHLYVIIPDWKMKMTFYEKIIRKCYLDWKIIELADFFGPFFSSPLTSFVLNVIIRESKESHLGGNCLDPYTMNYK